MNFKFKIDRCDKTLCIHGLSVHARATKSYSDLEIGAEDCEICGGHWTDRSFACMRSCVIIANQRVTFCYVTSVCSQCGHVDWFRPDQCEGCQNTFEVPFGLRHSRAMQLNLQTKSSVTNCATIRTIIGGEEYFFCIALGVRFLIDNQVCLSISRPELSPTCPLCGREHRYLIPTHFRSTDNCSRAMRECVFSIEDRPGLLTTALRVACSHSELRGSKEAADNLIVRFTDV